ncbi:hypothetical protein SDRG_09330 [Saprolegnia diclina VS20]|uniref:Uncharacterized protein n=1 Tax=Saprolegnia diclina (strain VS20) TaxID=1156394 RepID=T0Q661_SAPDV|nr:hypothetical protein SDRG_09330 [Saprolegnia diclina VS20]EQC33354.1 hypothetical protein SDRG_09330 [Saprolegnia diclina VS20]|eukprot:XP_008613477.1 hypothetical protein SDRG_09330 [Saprolegnia diclina VS20]
MNVSWYPKAALTEQSSSVVPLSPSGPSGSVGPPRLGRRRLVYYTTLAVWVFLSLNSFLDPFKTLYGYYVTTDSHEHASVWAIHVANAFNNMSSTVCDQRGPFLNCYFELPVFGVGTLAGAVCRSFYPVDKGDAQHIAFAWHDGGITQIRSFSKDLLRCCLLFIVAYFRVTSIYYPIWLVFKRQGQPFWTWAGGRHMGLVLHKRERRCLVVLFLLSFEALLSTEDIVMFCQHAVYTVPTSYTTIILTYMSITRIIWPSAFLLLALSRLLEWLLGPKYAFALSEDLFLLGAPVVWFYLPSYVTTQGMKLFQGYRWTGVVVHHYANTIHNAYSHQKDSWTLYMELFGYFTLLSSTFTIVLGFVWQSVTHMTSILAFLLSHQRYRREHALKDTTGTLENVLHGAADGLSPEIAYQVTKAKWPRSHRCEGMNLASEGLLCLVYGSTQVLATIEWGFVGPVFNPQGHAAVIEGNSVSFRPNVTRDTLSSITSTPTRVGIPDLI